MHETSGASPGVGLDPNGESQRRWRMRFLVGARKVLGTLLALNFAAVWAAPVMIQGQLFRRGLQRIVRPAYGLADGSAALRRFAARFIYRRPAHVDYFAAAVILIGSTCVLLSALFAWQIAFGSLPWWLVVLYYFVWVGPGGRGMATAWTLAHREGHLSRGRMYRPWLGERIGNFFENWLGVFYGNVPYNFSIAHTLLHHRLDAGKGDPVYLWDLDRTRFSDLMLYQWRFFRHMTGVASLVAFRRESGVHPSVDRARAKLRRGMAIYWVWVPSGIVALLIGTGSSVASALLFLFLVYLQPLFAMSTFISMITIGQHGFLEFDQSGRHRKHVTSTTILDGLDDSYGEDHHLAHHQHPSMAHDRLGEHVARERSEWARCDGTVFRSTTFIEITIMMAVGQFDRLVRDHYVDFSGEGNVQELASLFERRAKRKEMTYEHYEFRYLPGLRHRARELVSRGICKDENQAYIYQSQHSLQ